MIYRVAELVADCLVAHGVDRAFGVPGESFLALLAALRDRNYFDLVTCRHEGSASLAAVADAKLTGCAGVVMTSRGPGAFNAALGLHVAAQEAIPLVMLVGQVDRPNLARDAVQEIVCGRSFDGVLKWSVRLNPADLVREMIARALAVAHAGTPGPVAIELPEDLLEDPAERFVATANGAERPEPGAAAIEQARTALMAAERPILLVGGEGRTASFREDLVAFSEKWNVPVVTMNKMQDQFPNSHPLWAGQFGFFTSQPDVKLLERADVVVAVGTRLGDLSSLGFALPRQAKPRQPLVHVYPDPDAIRKARSDRRPGGIRIARVRVGHARCSRDGAGPHRVASRGCRGADGHAWLASVRRTTGGRLRSRGDGHRCALQARWHRHDRLRQFRRMGASHLQPRAERAAARLGLRGDGQRSPVRARRKPSFSGAAGGRLLRRRRLPDDGQ